MRSFTDLYLRLDETNKTNEKVAALVRYFESAPPEDSIWALSLLMGRRPRVPVKRTLLKRWAIEASRYEEWLFEECYSAVGDLSETFSLILPDQKEEGTDIPLSQWMAWIIELAAKDEESQRADILWAWNQLGRWEKFVFHKLIGGAFRIGVSSELVVRALSLVSGVDKTVLAHRLMGTWPTAPAFYEQLTSADGADEVAASQPYPFCLAHPLESDPNALGDLSDWQVEWKWDGIRAQLIRRQGETFLWSRGEEILNDTFPEIVAIGDSLFDGTVIDGEILAWDSNKPLSFAQLQRRLGRKAPGKKLLGEVPCALVAFDLVEHGGDDIRNRPLAQRREMLQDVVHQQIPSLRISETVAAASWEELEARREQSRTQFAEGLMLKRLDSDYTGGRKRGSWWKWKIAPFSVDAVLIYAQRGSGKRASLYTDYTFGVWSEGALVPFAKAYSGLTDAEIRLVDNFIRRNVVEKFGPVRTVKPELVFEIAFEGIQLSTRHKSGVAVRFPRILRWRQDKEPKDADSLEGVKDLLRAQT